MIVECIIETDFRGRHYKVGTQKNVLTDIGHFMISTGKWKGLGGKVQTDQEREFFASLEAQEPEPTPVVVVEPKKKSTRKKENS